MEQLRRDIKNRNINGLYLFYGEEKYLIKSYEKSFIKACVSEEFKDMNLSVFEGKNVSPDRIEEAAETLPFMSDRKLVVVRNSELFTVKRKNDGEKLSDYLTKRDGGAVLLFVEEEVDKRGKAYRAVNKFGKPTEFPALSEGRLATWIKETMRKSGLSISSNEAFYLIRISGGSMDRINMEMEKLAAYKTEGNIEKADIDAICIKTSEARVFDLIDAAAAKNRTAALAIYGELLEAKETPIGILAMLSRQFRLILKTKLLSEGGLSLGEITGKLGANPYSIKISAAQSKDFSSEALKKVVIDCADCDTRIKTGREEAALGVEMLIIKYTDAKAASR